MKEELLFGGALRLRQREGVFPLSMDTMALGDFASLRPGNRVWDLGCGSGALGLLLFGREPAITYTGIDCAEEACALAKENLAANHLAGDIQTGTIEALWELGPRNAADLVISNPPYFRKGRAGTPARTGCGLEAVCGAAGRLLKTGGRFALCYPARELAEVFAALRNVGVEPKRLRLAAHTAQAAPKLALVEGVRQGKPGLTLLPNLIWYRADGTPTAEYRRIYHETEKIPGGD